MAKKYYQGAKDRKDESKGMRKRMGDDAMYSGMLSADKSAIANMPQQVKYVTYPKEAYYDGPQLNDKISGIDAQISEDVFSKSLKRGSYPEKY